MYKSDLEGICYSECSKCGGDGTGGCSGKQCDHSYEVVSHIKKNGRGFVGAHWECINPECRFNDQANLYNTILGDCYAKCTKCKKVLPNLESAGSFSFTRQIFSGPEFLNAGNAFIGSLSVAGGYLGGVAGSVAGPTGALIGAGLGGDAARNLGAGILKENLGEGVAKMNLKKEDFSTDAEKK